MQCEPQGDIPAKKRILYFIFNERIKSNLLDAEDLNFLDFELVGPRQVGPCLLGTLRHSRGQLIGIPKVRVVASVLIKLIIEIEVSTVAKGR